MKLVVDGFDGFTRDMRPMALTPDLEMRFVVPSTEGLVMIRSDLDGEFDSQLLDTTLAGYPSGSVALPDGRLAIGSTWAPGAVLSVLNADGSVAWENKYGSAQDAEVAAIAYDATRNELLLGGAYRGNDHGTQRTWMIASDLDGNQTFEMTRKPQSTFGDGEIEEIFADRGPAIRGIAVSPSGQIAALGWTSRQLTYFLIEPGTCE